MDLKDKMINRGEYLGVYCVKNWGLDMKNVIEEAKQEGALAALEAYHRYQTQLKDTLSYADKFVIGRINEWLEIQKSKYNHVSLDSMNYQDEFNPTRLHDCMDVGGYVTPEDAIITKQRETAFHNAIWNIINRKDLINNAIVFERLLSDNPKIQQKIADEYGMSQRTISKREKNIIKELKEKLDGRIL
jgi:RNA polymerase sigma factor (sigma-70 family)